MSNENKAQTLGLDADGFIDERKLPEPEVGEAPISGERYYSKEFMQKEWDHVWTKVWLVAGLEEQVPNPGDRMTFDIGKESLLCTRDNDGKVRVFYNVCQHRGNKLVHEETSSGKTMACAYHGWRYKVDGTLASVPQAEDYKENPCKKLRLKELPSAVCGGFIWYSLNEDVMPLEEYLGPVHAQIQTYDLENMKRTHWVTVDCDFNWKIVQDNFNESYHLPFVHPSTKHTMEQSYKHCQMDIFEKEGHARMFMPGHRPTLGLKGNFDETLRLMQGDLDFWGLDGESFRSDPHSMREAMQKVRREKGAEKGFDYSGLTDNQLTDHYHYTIFPNFSVSLKPDGAFFLMATPHPTDPTRCFFDGWFLNWFPEDAKEYYSATMVQMVDFDTVVPHITGTNYEVSCGKVIDEDMAIWSTQQKGLMSQGYEGGYFAGQETRVRFFHEELDRHIARGEAAAE